MTILQNLPMILATLYKANYIRFKYNVKHQGVSTYSHLAFISSAYVKFMGKFSCLLKFHSLITE